MTRVRMGLGAVVAVAVAAATAGLSRAPVPMSSADEALLRLSWRMTGIAAEACRTLPPEELEKLPVHMRAPEVCTGHVASYRLTVRVDGTEVLDDVVRPAGARGDRPVTVLRDLPLEPGTYRVEVGFDAILPEGVDSPQDGTSSLSWRGEVDIAPRGVALITLAPGGRELEARSAKGAGG